MAQVHQLITRCGIDEARRQAATKEADPERLKNDSVSCFKRLRSAVLRRCFAKASVRREVA